MKKVILISSIIIFCIIISCNKRDNSIVRSKKHAILSPSNKKQEQSKQEIKKWIQYKKVPVIDQRDTLPLPNCYVEVVKDSLFYYFQGKLIEKHLLISKDGNKRAFYFKDKIDDYVYINSENMLLITRDYFEGLQEYFKPIPPRSHANPFAW